MSVHVYWRPHLQQFINSYKFYSRCFFTLVDLLSVCTRSTPWPHTLHCLLSLFFIFLVDRFTIHGVSFLPKISVRLIIVKLWYYPLIFLRLKREKGGGLCVHECIVHECFCLKVTEKVHSHLSCQCVYLNSKFSYKSTDKNLKSEFS